LRRLRTDYVDLLWVHVWDSVTPPEELLETMSTLIREGKARYWGISNSPAWYVAKVATLAAVSGKPGPIALQYAYSLVHREIEHEFVPLASEFGMAIQPWSPLAFGLLTGKYSAHGDEAKVIQDDSRDEGPVGARAGRHEAEKRLAGANPFGDSLFTDRNRAIVDVVKRVANECGESAARVALAWVIQRPGVWATLLGVSKADQIRENVAALDISLSSAHLSELDRVSLLPPNTLYSLFTPDVRQSAVFGGASVRAWSRVATG
jgi:aryl-alcohol dehydrogenase-like predicted oxidoreductase